MYALCVWGNCVLHHERSSGTEFQFSTTKETKLEKAGEGWLLVKIWGTVRQRDLKVVSVFRMNGYRDFF